jgi:hypothetical protein
VYLKKTKCVADGALLKELYLLRDGILTMDLSRSDICHLKLILYELVDSMVDSMPVPFHFVDIVQISTSN